MATYEHFIYASTERALAAVAAELIAAGYMVPNPPEYDPWPFAHRPEIDWQLVAYGTVEQAFADGGRDDIEAACEKHGAKYDGGGCFLAPPNPHS
ncbi:hypothetical protein ACQPW1_02285 [Nocardia sp. CA-128927]|uniref:hypothetical protein n=1 Tax=Nocardia sp. CA-128927 TaxID=3239975 RepID=UPI003D96CC8B